jgi:hypothetical protein
MTVDHIGEALIGFETLPFEARSPIVEEASCPGLALVVPQLTEGLLEEVGRVETLVGGQQNLERAFAFQGEVFMTRQQIVFLALDEAPAAPSPCRRQASDNPSQKSTSQLQPTRVCKPPSTGITAPVI